MSDLLSVGIPRGFRSVWRTQWQRNGRLLIRIVSGYRATKLQTACQTCKCNHPVFTFFFSSIFEQFNSVLLLWVTWYMNIWRSLISWGNSYLNRGLNSSRNIPYWWCSNLLDRNLSRNISSRIARYVTTQITSPQEATRQVGEWGETRISQVTDFNFRF